MNTTRILIADGRPKIRFALGALLKRQPAMEVAGEAGDVECLDRQIETLHPDVVLLDWWFKGRTTAALVPALKGRCPNLYVIVLSGRPEARRAALSAGADAFVSKIEPPGKLLAAIRLVQRAQAALPSLEERLQGTCVS
jgi:DNA-binding NarL/FixJ family response regulator